ncbi:MAG: tetratricopeptide repeat protein [Myxococcota bacterium]
MLARVLAFAVVLGSLVAVGRVSAQSEQAQAREWYETGVDLYERDEFAPALDAFRRAYALVPAAQLHFNMARCLSALGRHQEAAEEYRAAMESTDLSDEERARARAELLVARAELGTLQLRGEGSATIDGVACSLPCERFLQPGTHEVVFAGETQSVEVLRRETAAVELRPPAVTTEPAPREGYRPGPGTAIGAGLIALGVAGTIGFGLRTRSLEDDFDRLPDDATADQGERAQRLTNASIAIAAAGAVVWLVEILVRSLRRRTSEATARREIRPSAW